MNGGIGKIGDSIVPCIHVFQVGRRRKMAMKDVIKDAVHGGRGFATWANLRDIAVIFLLLVAAYRLAVPEISIDLSGFGFTDLLSMILAISAIALSAAFYFKADESSKNFYNNSYGFTKNISELLGRIEERFGAQLVSLNQGYDVLSKRFDAVPIDVKAVKEEQRKEVETIEKNENEYQQIIEGLMVKAKLDDSQMNEMKKSMANLVSEVDRAKSELAKHQASLENGEISPLAISDELFTSLVGLVRDNFSLDDVDLPLSHIARKFSNLYVRGKIGSRVLSEMSTMGLCHNGSLTLKGAKFLRTAINAQFN